MSRAFIFILNFVVIQQVETLKKNLAKKERNEINWSINILLHFEDEIQSIKALGNVGEIGSGERVEMPSTMPTKCQHFKDRKQPTTVHVEASSNLMSNQVHQADFLEDEEEHMMMNNILLMPQSPPTLFENFV